MKRDVDAALTELTSEQFGAITRKQANGLGASSGLLRRRINAGTFTEATDRVLVLAGTTDSFEQRATIATLDAGPGAGLSIITALAYFGVPGFAREPLHLSRPRRDNRAPMTGVVWHHPRLLPSHHLIVVNGLTLTTPTRALADLFLTDTHPNKIERSLDTARSARVTNHVLLSRMAGEWCERGRRGSAALRDYLERKPIDWVPPQSNLAGRFIKLIVDAGMPEPRSEVNLGNEVAWLGRVDCLDPELPLIAEIDSDRFHTAPLDAAADAERDENMAIAGFEVVRFTETEVWHSPRVVVDRWRNKRREVRRDRAS